MIVSLLESWGKDMPAPTKIDRLTKPKALKGHDKLVRVLLRYGDAHNLNFYFKERAPEERFDNKNEVKKFTYLLGGDIAVGKYLGINRLTPYQWGILNRIPHKYWNKLAEMAKEKDVEFPLESFKAREIEKLNTQLENIKAMKMAKLDKLVS